MEEEKLEMKKITCPFCGEFLEKQEYITELIEKYKCHNCNTEIKHPLIRPKKDEVKNKIKHPITENCEACKSSQFQCDRCSDSVCEEHRKNIEKTMEKFSEEQRIQFRKIAGNCENVCISCLMAIISGVKQKSVDEYNSIVENRYKKGKFPWLIFLPILVLIGFLMSKIACK